MYHDSLAKDCKHSAHGTVPCINLQNVLKSTMRYWSRCSKMPDAKYTEYL